MSATQQDVTSYDLSRYWTVLRRRWWIVALVTLLGAAAGAAYAYTAPRAITANTLVSINLTTAADYSAQRPPSQLIDPLTEQQLARSATVLSTAAETLQKAGIDLDQAQLRRDSTVTVMSDTTVARVSFTSGSRDEAEAGADAVAQAYVDFRGDQASARVERLSAQLEGRIEALQGRLQAINNVLSQAPTGSARAGEALSDRSVVTLRLTSLVSQLNGLTSVDTNGGQIETPAADSSVSISPHRALLMEIGLLFGLVLGLIAAFAVGAFDRRLRDPFDVSRAGAGDVLAVVPGSTIGFPPHGKDLDALRTVRERLLATLPGDSPIVAVSDLTSHTSDIGPNLAYVLGETGRRTDLVLPGVDPTYLESVVAGFGLTDQGETDGVRYFSGGLLDVLVPAPGTMLSGRSAVRSEAAADDETEITIIALPPGAPRSQLLGAARLGRAVVLVMSRGKARKSHVSSLSQELGSVGAEVYGTVFVSNKRILARSNEARSPRTGSESTTSNDVAVVSSGR